MGESEGAEKREGRGLGADGSPIPDQPHRPQLPLRGPHLFHPERKPRSWSRGKPARGRSLRKWQTKASVGKRSWRRVGINKLSQI